MSAESKTEMRWANAANSLSPDDTDLQLTGIQAHDHDLLQHWPSGEVLRITGQHHHAYTLQRGVGTTDPSHINAGDLLYLIGRAANT